MTVVSSKEFATHQDKYFDLAQNEEVCIERGVNMFYLVCKSVKKHNEEDIIFQPNDELHSCITMDEVRTRTRERIHQYFANKK